MQVRLYCTHCQKHYEVEVDNVKLLQKHNSQNLKFQNNTYYYDGGCFFKDVVILKRQVEKNG